MAKDENRAIRINESEVLPAPEWDAVSPADLPRHSLRPLTQESPLVGLSRRRDRMGKPFLGRELVAVGERLREDYELVELALDGQENWHTALEDRGFELPSDVTKGANDALDRLRRALAELGPGLGDVALRCCCFLEGLEQTEKTMGWSARSGKIVLRIALERLKRHYAQTEGKYGPLIG